jgi:hypothetical protein
MTDIARDDRSEEFMRPTFDALHARPRHCESAE